jgi:glycerol-3-phosphate dehydrogenase (NAD(P)+)
MIKRRPAIGVLGGGAWGTALAQVAASAGCDVLVWAFETEVVDDINQKHVNSVFLPNITLNDNIKASSDFQPLGELDAVLSVVPAQFTRATLQRFAPFARAGLPIALCSKGIEQSTLLFMTDVLAQTVPQAIPVVISGPSFAKDVAIGKPTAVTLACEDRILGEKLNNLLGIATFRPYWVDDLIGTEIGGAVKNVLAIACGMAEGRNLGESARAALITRGFAEMTRLGIKLGAKPETLMGLCGLGDLVLTCSSTSSRNFSLGRALGEGQSVEQALSGKLSVAEGAATAPALAALAKRENVEMPICQAVDAILCKKLTVDAAINALLNRPFREEGK